MGGGRRGLTLPKYQPFWCEENVWHLCAEAGAPFAVFVASTARACPMWAQRAGDPVVWDYHVVALAPSAEGTWDVWDLDSTLGMPVPAGRWLDATFAGHDGLRAEFRPWFRVVARDELLATFASDRAHMRDAAGGWQQAPPPWPPIGAGRPSNLMRFVDMAAPFAGEVLDLAAFRARFAPTR